MSTIYMLYMICYVLFWDGLANSRKICMLYLYSEGFMLWGHFASLSLLVLLMIPLSYNETFLSDGRGLFQEDNEWFDDHENYVNHKQVFTVPRSQHNQTPVGDFGPTSKTVLHHQNTKMREYLLEKCVNPPFSTVLETWRISATVT